MKRILYLITTILIFLTPGCVEEPTETTGTIVGLVADASNGSEPLAGVSVSIPATGASAITNNSGNFVFNDVTPGSYTLQFSKSGYVTESKSVSVVAGQSANVSVQMKPTEKIAEISFNPSSLNFGTVLTDLSVVITNNGNATAEWSINLGNNPWLSVSENAGSIQKGRTQSIVFSVDRNYLAEPKSTVVNLHAFGNSYPLTISCAPSNAKSEMSIDPKNIDFGMSDTERTLTIRNTGTAPLSWTASGITVQALSLSASSGTVSAGGNTTVKVLLDRSQLQGALSTSFTINDGVREEVISVSANTSGGGDNPGTTPDPGNYVVPNGLLAYFPFNGNFKDISGNDIFGFGSPEPKFTDGVISGSKAASFNRIDKNNFIVNYGLIDSKAITVSFWAKNISEGDIFFVESSSSLSGSKMMSFTCRDGHLKYVVTRLNHYWTSNFDRTGNFTHKSLDDGQWHHIALVSDYNRSKSGASTSILYIDGKKMDTVIEEFSESTGSNAHFGTGIKFTLGGENTPSFQMANLRVYDARTLSADEIKTIFDAKQ